MKFLSVFGFFLVGFLENFILVIAAAAFLPPPRRPSCHLYLFALSLSLGSDRQGI